MESYVSDSQQVCITRGKDEKSFGNQSKIIWESAKRARTRHYVLRLALAQRTAVT